MYYIAHILPVLTAMLRLMNSNTVERGTGVYCILYCLLDLQGGSPHRQMPGHWVTGRNPRWG